MFLLAYGDPTQSWTLAVLVVKRDFGPEAQPAVGLTQKFDREAGARGHAQPGFTLARPRRLALPDKTHSGIARDIRAEGLRVGREGAEQTKGEEAQHGSSVGSGCGRHGWHP